MLSAAPYRLVWGLCLRGEDFARCGTESTRAATMAPCFWD